MDEPLDITKLKYVLYARKSTSDETRQVRSIQDQITDCTLLATQLGLKIVKILRETQSAKKPNIRPVFRQMINDIKKGIYNAILAWNPDRLARNMLEGGEIIDLIDQGIIQDLKFKTHYFTKDANGLMLLGMAFVLSKQYSDDLSQKVTRGVRSRFKEGKTSIPKHGYINEGGVYKPDGKNFDLICEAWQLRLQGQSLEYIASYMNKNSFGRKVKKDGKIIKINKKKLSEIFKDSFYYGELVQANQTVDLRELPGYNFKPAITQEEYNKVQLLTRRRSTPYNTNKLHTFYPFKAIIKCGFCDSNMRVGPSTSGGGKRILYYRCDNPDCKRKKKSIRGKVILDFLYEFFTKYFKLTEKDYKHYYEKVDKLTGERRVKLQTQIRSLQGSVAALGEAIRDRSLKIADLSLKGTAKEMNEAEIDKDVAEKEQTEAEVVKLKTLLTDPDKDRLTLKQFLNLSKKADEIIKSADNVKKDVVVRLIFLNLNVDNQKVLSYQLKPPFDTMLKSRLDTSSRGGQI